MADMLDMGSAITERWPRVGKLIGGAPNVRSYTPVRWRHARMAVVADGDWAEFEAAPESGKTPRNYRMAAILNVDSQKLDRAQEYYGGTHAVAYALGTAIMVGVMPENKSFSTESEPDEAYAVAMRIGRGVLRATAGLWLSEGAIIVPAGSVHKAPIPTMPVEHISVDIPLV